MTDTDFVDENDEDIFLSEREVRKVFHGDEVLVSILGKTRRGGIEGKDRENN